MRIKGAFIATSLMCCFAFVPVADAGKRRAPDVSSAVSGWVVGPIQVGNDNAPSYCSMKSSYDNDTMLVIARDAALVNSVAVDFQSDMLEKGREYNVSLSIPGGVVREVVAAAVSPQIMVMQLGRDDVFYDAVKRKDQLDVVMNGYDTSFSLRGTSQAVSDLEDCVATLGGGFVGDGGRPAGMTLKVEKFPAEREVPVVEATEPSFDAAELEKNRLLSQLETLQGEVEGLKRQNHEIRTQLAGAAASRLEPASGDAKAVAAVTTAKTDATDDLRDTLVSVSGGELSPERTEVPGDKAYSWKRGDVFGGAYQMDWERGKSFEAMAGGYVESVKALCEGDFASKLSEKESSGGIEIQQAEIACVEKETDTSVAALFYGVPGGRFTVITFAGTAEQLMDAMAGRDALEAALRQKGLL